MFFCCQTEQKGEYALEVYETPGEMSAISSEKEVVLKAMFTRQPRSRVVDRMGRYQKRDYKRLDSIITYMKSNK
jgi:hypothetical protein